MRHQEPTARAEVAEEADEGKTLRVVLEVPPDFPTSYVSNLAVSHDKHDFTITFFDVRPPLLLGSTEEKAKQLHSIDQVSAVPRARIVVAATRMHEFVQVLTDNLKHYQDTQEEEKETTTKP